MVVAVTDEEFSMKTSVVLGGIYCSQGCICITSAQSLECVPVLLLLFSGLSLHLNKPLVTNGRVLIFDQNG